MLNSVKIAPCFVVDSFDYRGYAYLAFTSLWKSGYYPAITQDASASRAFFMPTVYGGLAQALFGEVASWGDCSNLCQTAAQHYIKRQSS